MEFCPTDDEVSRQRHCKRLQTRGVSATAPSPSCCRYRYGVSESRNIIRAVGGVLAVAAVCSACASTGATPRPFPMPGGSPASPAPAASAHPADPAQVFDGYALVGTALALRGTPYRNGGSDPHGFDCSGFTQYVFAQYGVTLPRDVADQFKQGKSVMPKAIEAGDLIFFSTTGSGASHVA